MTLHDNGAFFCLSIARSLLVYQPVLSSFALLTCVLLFLPLRVRRMDESLQQKSILNLLFAICLSVSLFVYCMPCLLSPCLLIVSYSLSVYLFMCLSAFVLFYQWFVSLSANLSACLSEDPYVSPHLP